MIEPTICLVVLVVGLAMGWALSYAYHEVDKVHRKRNPKTGRWTK